MGLTFDSLWLDEGYQSIVDAYGRPAADFSRVPDRPFIFKPGSPTSPSEMLQNFRKVDPLTPPLYQLLLNRWIAWFGDRDATLRGLSVFFSTLGVGLLFCFSRRVFGLRAAWFVGLAAAFSGFDRYYGQEVRMYALLQLASLLSCFSLILLLLHYERGRKRIASWLMYVFATWAVINSHYTGLFLVVYEGLLGLACALGRRSVRLLALLCAAWGGVLLLWAPWWQMFRQAAAMRTESFYVARAASLWWPFFALFLQIPINWMTILSAKGTMWFAKPLYVTSFLALAYGFRAIFRLERRARIAGAMIIGWALVPSLVLWVLDVAENHKVIEMARYVMASAPAVYVIGGLGLAALWKRRSRLGIAVVVLHFVLCAANNIAHATINHEREDWRHLAWRLSETVPADELVLVAQHYDIYCLNRYLRTPLRQVGVDTPMSAEALEQVLAGVRQFTLVTAQEGFSFASKIPARYRLVESKVFAHGPTMRRYSL